MAGVVAPLANGGRAAVLAAVLLDRGQQIGDGLAGLLGPHGGGTLSALGQSAQAGLFASPPVAGRASFFAIASPGRLRAGTIAGWWML